MHHCESSKATLGELGLQPRMKSHSNNCTNAKQDKKNFPSTRRPTLSERFNMTIIFIWLSKEKSDVYYGARIKYWQCVSAAPGVWESSGLQTLASGRVHAQIPRAPCHAMPCHARLDFPHSPIPKSLVCSAWTSLIRGTPNTHTMQAADDAGRRVVPHRHE